MPDDSAFCTNCGEPVFADVGPASAASGAASLNEPVSSQPTAPIGGTQLWVKGVDDFRQGVSSCADEAPDKAGDDAAPQRGVTQVWVKSEPLDDNPGQMPADDRLEPSSLTDSSSRVGDWFDRREPESAQTGANSGIGSGSVSDPGGAVERSGDGVQPVGWNASLENDPEDREQTIVVPKTHCVLVRKVDSREFSLDLPCVVGRGSSCGARILGNRAISRTHAELREGADGFSIRDLSSTNSTFVGGVEVPTNGEAALRDGDEIRLGDELFVFEVRSYGAL